MHKILVDTGPLVALFNRRDNAHDTVTNWLQDFDGQLLTTWPVLTEVGHLIPQHLLPMVLKWAASGGLVVVEIPEPAIAVFAELTEKYADRPMDLADASLVWLGSEIDIVDILTLDHADFATYRSDHGLSFNDLLRS